MNDNEYFTITDRSFLESVKTPLKAIRGRLSNQMYIYSQ